MDACRWMKQIEAYADGESGEQAQAIEAHVGACRICADYLAQLRRIRDGVSAVARRETIQDAQFPAFMRGIREGIELPAPAYRRGAFAILSFGMAALIVAVAAFAVLSGGPAPVKATEVESAYTDLEGATLNTYNSEDGVTTIWVTVGKDDVW